MFEVLTVFSVIIGVLGAIFAGVSATAWHKSAKLPVPKLPAIITTAPAFGPGIGPITMLDEAKKVRELGATMGTFLKASNDSAALNRKAAGYSMWAAGLAAASLLLPKINDLGVWLTLWSAQS